MYHWGCWLSWLSSPGGQLGLLATWVGMASVWRMMSVHPSSDFTVYRDILSAGPRAVLMVWAMSTSWLSSSGGQCWLLARAIRTSVSRSRASRLRVLGGVLGLPATAERTNQCRLRASRRSVQVELAALRAAFWCRNPGSAAAAYCYYGGSLLLIASGCVAT